MDEAPNPKPIITDEAFVIPKITQTPPIPKRPSPTMSGKPFILHRIIASQPTGITPSVPDDDITKFYSFFFDFMEQKYCFLSR